MDATTYVSQDFPAAQHVEFPFLVDRCADAVVFALRMISSTRVCTRMRGVDVGAQQRQYFLDHPVGAFGPQYDSRAPHLRLHRAQGRFDLPSGTVQLGQLAGRDWRAGVPVRH